MDTVRGDSCDALIPDKSLKIHKTPKPSRDLGFYGASIQFFVAKAVSNLGARAYRRLGRNLEFG